jgi:YfiH family protein
MSKTTYFFGNKITGTIQHKNVSLHNFDDEVLKFYQLKQFVMLKQVHGIDGFDVTPELFTHPLSVEEHVGDFLMTDQQRVGLAVITADCLPVLVTDEKRDAIGIAHAGWRGTVAQIVPQMIFTMRETYGSQYSDMQFYFGPGGRPCCYEVQPDFMQNLNQFPWADQLIAKRDGKLFFDNALCNKLQLFDRGIKQSQIIHQARECTICNDSFHSYRREGARSQRQMSLVWLTG